MIKRFSAPARRKYDTAFAKIIDSLNTSEDFFKYIFERKSDKGIVDYHGATVEIHIIAPKKSFGTGVKGILFEETWHAKQFLDGDTYFKCTDTGWYPFNNLWLEVEAKMFAANHVKVKEVFFARVDTSYMYVFTELGYMKGYLTTDSQRADYLKHGGGRGIIIVRYDKSIALPHPEPLYPKFGYDTFPNLLDGRKKNDSVFGYRRRRPAIVLSQH
jgi:hypothetical protein